MIECLNDTMIKYCRIISSKIIQKDCLNATISVRNNINFRPMFDSENYENKIEKI